ncbi:MAG: 4-alpha-glucanotransferase [Clostridia bacterium]|nr:4-alpha-glucanotransferase [Clostridia bacterium]
MKRQDGVLMHVSSLPGEFSTGDFGRGAYAFVDFLAECGFSYWQVLPFCVPDECASPYKSYSAFSGNPYFIDLNALYEEGLITADEREAAKQKSPYLSEFERLERERLPLLAKAAERFADFDAIEAFLEAQPYIRRFCLFMAYKAANNDAPWRTWDTEKRCDKTYRTWAFAEYTFFTQWKRLKAYANEKGIKFLGDIPIYVAYESADVFSEPHLFQLDEDNLPKAVAGVPPDYFSEDGQMWGNPLYDWDAIAKEGFGFWRSRIAHMLTLFDGVRLDHFRGFDTYYSIPYGAPNARSGKWCKGPGRALVKAIKEVAGDALIVAEDLGEMAPSVEKLLSYSGFPGMRVFQFGFLGDEESRHLPHNYGKNAVAYTGTHDNNTLLGYIWEVDPQTRRKIFDYVGFKGEDWRDGCENVLRSVLASHADLVIFPIQDILLYGRDTRMNTPGVAEGNWAYRVTAEQLGRIDCRRLAYLKRLYDRA